MSRINSLRSMTKMRQDDDVIDSTGPLDENETKLFG